MIVHTQRLTSNTFGVMKFFIWYTEPNYHMNLLARASLWSHSYSVAKKGGKNQINSERIVKNRTITNYDPESKPHFNSEFGKTLAPSSSELNNGFQLNLKIDWEDDKNNDNQGYQVGSGSPANENEEWKCNHEKPTQKRLKSLEQKTNSQSNQLNMNSKLMFFNKRSSQNEGALDLLCSNCNSKFSLKQDSSNLKNSEKPFYEKFMVNQNHYNLPGKSPYEAHKNYKTLRDFFNINIVESKVYKNKNDYEIKWVKFHLLFAYFGFGVINSQVVRFIHYAS